MIGLISLAIVLAFTFIGPPIKRGTKGATNSGFRVTLPYAADTEASGQSPAGVKAQEVAEFRLAWLCGIVAALPFALLVPEPINGAAIIFAALVMLLARKLTNHFDYVGHNVEIMVAEKEGRDGYREQEIARMIKGDQLGMNAAEVDAKLRKWHWLAQLAIKLT